MRNYIRLQLSHVKPANYMSTNNIDIGISQITIITIYYDKQFLYNEIIYVYYKWRNMIYKKRKKKYFKLEFIGLEMIASKTKRSHLFITSLSPYNQAQTRPFI